MMPCPYATQLRRSAPAQSRSRIGRMSPLITFEHKNDSSNVKPCAPCSAPKRWGMARLGHTRLWMVILYIIIRALFESCLEHKGGWLGKTRQHRRRGIENEPAA